MLTFSNILTGFWLFLNKSRLGLIIFGSYFYVKLHKNFNHYLVTLAITSYTELGGWKMIKVPLSLLMISSMMLTKMMYWLLILIKF